MDFRQYDAALGRFNAVDRLTELAPGMTPYRFGFNNPNYWRDPTGLFESWYHAIEYMLTNNISGTVRFENGSYSISVLDDDGNYYKSIERINGEIMMGPIATGGGGGSSSGNGGNGSPIGLARAVLTPFSQGFTVIGYMEVGTAVIQTGASSIPQISPKALTILNNTRNSLGKVGSVAMSTSVAVDAFS